MTLQRRQITLREKSWPLYIPTEVLAQLKYHLHELPDPIKGMVMLLLECGLRVSELCAACRLPGVGWLWEAVPPQRAIERGR